MHSLVSHLLLFSVCISLIVRATATKADLVEASIVAAIATCSPASDLMQCIICKKSHTSIILVHRVERAAMDDVACPDNEEDESQDDGCHDRPELFAEEFSASTLEPVGRRI